MPISGQSSHGDLFIEYNVILPVELSQQTRRSKSVPKQINIYAHSSPELADAFSSATSTHDEL